MTELTIDPDAWIRRSHEAPATAPRLVCFPHAGGAATFFFPLSAAIKPEGEVLSVQYPGRQDRRKEAPFESIHQLADHAAAALKDHISDRTIFFGHSMGATVAFETIRRLEQNGGLLPRMFVASGRRAPSRYRQENVHVLDDDRLIRELKELSGTHEALLTDDEILRMILPAIRADYAAIAAYRCEPGATISVPISAFVGDIDPKVSVDEVKDWSRHTTAGFHLDVLPGGHFYLSEHPALLVERLLGLLRLIGER